MLQHAFTYLILSAAIAYVGFRFYASIKKKQACDKCELMKAAKQNQKNKLA
ncbi:MAG: hypothetical protein K0Q95_2857 [Bacteroidota bacterium]|jgi:hypothetical protein|nr:hypothetical protein [Bacteroidota bacterium]